MRGDCAGVLQLNVIKTAETFERLVPLRATRSGTGELWKQMRAYYIQGGDAKEALRVVNALLLQYLCSDWHCGIHGVGDDVQQGLRASGYCS